MLLLVGLIAVVQGVVYVLVSQASQRNAIEHIRQNLGWAPGCSSNRCRNGSKRFRPGRG